MQKDITPLSEKVPVDHTIQVIEFIKNEQERHNVERYIEETAPFGDKTSVKYRRRFFERFVECNGDEIIYTPLLRFINNVSGYQTKKEVIYFITCIKHRIVSEIVKAFGSGMLQDNCTSADVKKYMKKLMPDASDGTINKTYSTVIGILKDFNILMVQSSNFIQMNTGYKPSNESIAFCLYYEFLKFKDNRMPSAEKFMDADTFKYFLMSENLIKRYTKWLMSEGYIDYYAMGDNTQYQFSFNTLEDFVEKVAK